ncbi:MAG TPA: class IV adenylate cyclase [Candidatus Paceibacterota bacterium]
MYEVEIKAYLKNREEVIKKLQSLGCFFGEELHQVDHIFIPDRVSFPPPITTPVLRVRNQNGIFIFTLKISQSGRQDSIERELEVGDGETMMEILKLLKYKETIVVDKRRIKTKLGDVEIVLDDVKDLGDFIEAEKIVSNENPEERKKIQSELCGLLETLGVAKEDLLVNQKYDIMLNDVYKKFGVK